MLTVGSYIPVRFFTIIKIGYLIDINFNCNQIFIWHIISAARTSSTSAIIGGAVGGSVVLLLVILVTVLVCRKCNPR